MIIAASPNSKRIPTILGLIGVLSLVVVVAVTVRGAGQITKFFPQAESPTTPAAVGVANVTDAGATIYWSSDKDATGSIFYGKTAALGEGVGVDDRDLTSQNNKYPTHLVHLTALKPQTKYYFKIGVGSESFGDPTKNGEPYELTTGATLSTAPVIDPIFGKVNDSAGTPASGAIVVWETSRAGKIATLTKTDGSYVLPVGNARTVDLSAYLSPTDGLAETINVNPGNSNSVATINCSVGKDRPLPTVKFGDAASCSQKTDTGGFKAPAASTSATVSAGTLTIKVENGETLSSPLPTFSGTAGPNQIIQITVQSDTAYSGSVAAGPDGNWSWTPPANLSAGQHSVTITVVNPDGTTQTVTRTFTVSSGTSILPVTSGTPSAQLTHMACAGNTCAILSGMGPNTCATNSDCAPIIATPPAIPIKTPPATGSTEITLAMLTLGAIFATLGTVLIFK